MVNGRFNTSLIREGDKDVIPDKRTPSVETEGGKPKPTAYEKIVTE